MTPLLCECDHEGAGGRRVLASASYFGVLLCEGCRQSVLRWLHSHSDRGMPSESGMLCYDHAFANEFIGLTKKK
jgi:hypothetical protein